MSGGSMDYAYYKIREAADAIQRELANYELKKKRCTKTSAPCKRYVEEHPDVPYLQDASGAALRDEVIKHLSEAVRVCRLAAIYAERVEWLTSGDDGEEAFCLRTAEEVAECNRTGGVE